MTICPYCSFVSISRRQHVLHLETYHKEAHANCVARSRGATICTITQCVKVPANTLLGPVTTQLIEPPQDNLPSLPWTIHCTVCIEYESKWIPAPFTMELSPKCCDPSKWCSDRCVNDTHERCLHLYCRGGVCWYPHDQYEHDDRIRDWGCRGRVGNVYCKGHIPRLCPVDAEWLKSCFSQASIPQRFSTRLPPIDVATTKPIIRNVNITENPLTSIPMITSLVESVSSGTDSDVWYTS